MDEVDRHRIQRNILLLAELGEEWANIAEILIDKGVIDHSFVQRVQVKRSLSG